ncbi:DUF4232 domain-containing protein [Streptomyces goshikiensis]|uniref:DUF4232 domain-containing protein n=1 Tax=Streptomyces goshikiensis TaxID=1942 RepID=UPI003661FED9
MKHAPNGARARAGWLALAALVLAGTGPAAATAAAAADQQAPRHAPAAQCQGGRLSASAAGGYNQVRVTVVNKGSKPCTLSGFPTVALAGQGSPDRNKPLSVARQGSAKPVQLAPGGRAVTTITFTPVLGEADGYCASGAKPTVAPTMVLGIAGTRTQVAPNDGGEFALCGGMVTASAFRSA